MYAINPEQGVNLRGLALAMRARALETGDAYYRRLFQDAAMDLEIAAEQLEREAWRPH